MSLSIRPLFRWKYSSFVIGLLAPTGIGAVMAKYYWPAYACFLWCGIHVTLQWFLSDSRRQNRDNIERLRAKVAKTEKLKEESRAEKTETDSTKDKHGSALNKAVLNIRLLDIGIPLIAFLVTGGLSYWVYVEKEDYELSMSYGVLYPRNEEILPNVCSRLNDAFLRVFLGPIVGAIDRYPRTIVRRREKDILKFDRNEEDGSVAVSLDIRNADGKLVVRIEKGQFTLSEVYAWDRNKRRPDRSRLKVVDDTGKAVLELDFFNPKAMRINMVTDGIEMFDDNLTVDGIPFPLLIDPREYCWGSSPTGSHSGGPVMDVRM